MYTTAPEHIYTTHQPWFPLSEDILAWDQDFHTLMLNDYIRMDAYKRAIKEVVKPGMSVLDLGTGTGILSLWALEAGAKHVYGIDANAQILPLARQRIEEAGFRSQYSTFNALSYDVNLPEQVDIIMSEILGNLADNEDMAAILNKARRQFLKPGGSMLPHRVTSYLAPVSSDKAWMHINDEEIRTISPRYDVIDLMTQLGTKNRFNLYYDTVIPRSDHLGAPSEIQKFYFHGADRREYGTSKQFWATRDGILHGFKGWFSAELSPNVTLDIGGDDIDGRRTSDCWKHCFLPIETPIEVQTGDRIQFRFRRYYPKERTVPLRQGYSWSGIVSRHRRKIGEFSHQTTNLF